MRIDRATCVNVGGGLPVPLGNARRTWRERHGMLVRLFDDAGTVGQGEASPLPGYSPEDLDAARAALAREPWQRLPEIDTTAPLLPQVRHVVEGIDPAAPSARFAVETALLDLIGRRLGRPVWDLLSDGAPAGPVGISRAIDLRDRRHAVETARKALERGAAAIKAKVGTDWPAERDALSAIRDELGDGVSIRVDANRSFPREQTAERLLELAALGVDLVEEPCPTAALEELDATPVPLALDESVQGPGGPGLLSRLAQRRVIRFVILKPTTLGGLTSCMALARHARAAGVEPIVTHTLDGPVAMAAACALAVALPAPRHAAGLERHPGLGAYPEIDLPMLGAKRIIPSEAPGLGIAPLPAR